MSAPNLVASSTALTLQAGIFSASRLYDLFTKGIQAATCVRSPLSSVAMHEVSGFVTGQMLMLEARHPALKHHISVEHSGAIDGGAHLFHVTPTHYIPIAYALAQGNRSTQPAA